MHRIVVLAFVLGCVSASKRRLNDPVQEVESRHFHPSHDKYEYPYEQYSESSYYKDNNEEIYIPETSKHCCEAPTYYGNQKTCPDIVNIKAKKTVNIEACKEDVSVKAGRDIKVKAKRDVDVKADRDVNILADRQIQEKSRFIFVTAKTQILLKTLAATTGIFLESAAVGVFRAVKNLYLIGKNVIIRGAIILADATNQLQLKAKNVIFLISDDQLQVIVKKIIFIFTDNDRNTDLAPGCMRGALFIVNDVLKICNNNRLFTVHLPVAMGGSTFALIGDEEQIPAATGPEDAASTIPEATGELQSEEI